ncbi:MAG: glycosyltransferase family 9 protein [Ignavibacteria bacterium]|nr:glycosyltransferase family 9 protein [Ignavibacteria bacterium]
MVFFKNLIGFFIFNFLKLLIKDKKEVTKNNLLFVNTEQIGDLVVSSLILENENLFSINSKIYFLIKDIYKNIFSAYNGSIILVFYNHKKYKNNLFYRFKTLKKLQNLNLAESYNVSPARGTINDEITLISGTTKKFTTCSDLKYLGKYFGKYYNKKYTELLFQNETNEYKKIINLIERLTNNPENKIVIFNEKTFNININIRDKIPFQEDYIVISPLTTNPIKNWGTDNYRQLCKSLSKDYNMLIIGLEKDINILKNISSGNTRIWTGSFEYIPSILSKSKLFIGNDSGLTHLAYRLDIPMIAIIGGGSYGKFFPFESKSRKNKAIYLFHYLDCFGCRWECKMKDTYCLSKITVHDVLKTIQKITE